MENSYWNQKGKHQKEFDELLKLMPISGNADTLAGEIVRAYNRVAYDYYNNGMINNTSGALNFLEKHKVISEDIKSSLYNYSRVSKYASGDDLEININELINSGVLFILNNPELKNTPNEDNIFNYQDEDITTCDSCGCEVEGSSMWSSYCDGCEELQESEDDYYNPNDYDEDYDDE